MKNFGRAIRLSLRYRFTFAASLFCALMVAVLWGGNIAAISPFAEIAFENRTPHDWVAERIGTLEERVQGWEKEAADVDRQLSAMDSDDPDARALAARRNGLRSQIASESRALKAMRWAEQQIVAPYLPKDPFANLALIVVVLLVGTFVKGLFLIAHQILVARLTQLATFDLSKQFFRRTLRMDLASFGSAIDEEPGAAPAGRSARSRHGGKQLLSRFTYDMDSLTNGLYELLGKLVREPLKMVACLIGAAWISWRLLLFSLLLAPIAAYSIRWLAKVLKSANRRAMEEMSQIYAVLDEAFSGIKVVKAFTMERYERRRFHQYNKKYLLKALRIARYNSLTKPLTELLGIASIALTLLAGAYLVIPPAKTHLFGIRMCDEPLGVTSFLAFYGLLAGLGDPARKLSEVFSRVQRGAAAADRIYQLIDREPKVVEAAQPRQLASFRRDLVFRGIGFHYEPGNTVLSDVNLEVPFGQSVAIVGPNGCGKSTLVNLIPRFFDPVSGSIQIGDADLRELRLRDLRRRIGLVTQETLLFDDTVSQNIRYGSPQATDEQVIEAAKRAHAHRFIEQSLEHGYQTNVGPRGSLLSGGQRQRIALARAILRDPDILILDEATSQIDLESEQLIHTVLQEFIRNRTTFMITHRLSTLALADRIVVMDSGRILDVGSHEELLARCDFYRRLHDIKLRDIA